MNDYMINLYEQSRKYTKNPMHDYLIDDLDLLLFYSRYNFMDTITGKI